MTHRQVVANGLEYDLAPDTPPLVAHRDWAVASAQILDDIRGDPLSVPYTARIALPGAQGERRQDGTWAPRIAHGITVKTGAMGTFALVARPWLRFTPFFAPANVTVSIDAAGFVPLQHAFAIAYDQRLVAAPAPAVSDQAVTLNSTSGLVAGQTLLFGPPDAPQYVRIRTVGGANQVTVDAGLTHPHAIGEVVSPDWFSSPPTVALALRRAAVRLFGRVVVRDTTANTSAPVVNASITVSDFWRTAAAIVADPTHGAMTDPNPALRQFAVGIGPGALATRAAGAAVGALGLPPVVSDDRLLLELAIAGGNGLEVSRRQNLLPPPAPLANRLLRIGPTDPATAEYQTIAAVEAAGTPDEPARLTLDLTLRHTHEDGTPVARINAPLALPPTPRVLRDATAPGDRCLFLDGLGALPPTGTLRVAGGGAVDEFQHYTRLAARSDADGYYSLPPIQRIARVALTVDDGAGNVQTVEVDTEYGEAEQRLDFVYPV